MRWREATDHFRGHQVFEALELALAHKVLDVLASDALQIAEADALREGLGGR